MSNRSKLMPYIMYTNTVLMGIGYYMLIPLLSAYLYNVKLFTAVMVGYVLSSSQISSNICMIFGGTLGDIIGCKKTMVAGCLARVLAFVIFGFTDNFFMYIVAGSLIGLGGALFLPACSAYYDLMSTDENRAQMYTLQNMLDSSGNIIGPTVGTILMGLYGFKAMCLLCIVIYLASVVITMLFLPELKNTQVGHKGIIKNVAASIVDCTKNTKFIILLLATSMITFFSLQRDLGVPVKLAEINPDYSVGYIYTVAAIIGVALQMPMVNYMRRRFSDWTSYSVATVLYCIGLSVMGFGNSIVTLYAGTILYTLGMSLSTPIRTAQIAECAGRGKVAGYYGFQGLVGIIIALLGNVFAGWLYDVSTPLSGIAHYTPWLVFLGIGAISLLVMFTLNKKDKKPDKTNLC